jgi:hypothetical protein
MNVGCRHEKHVEIIGDYNTRLHSMVPLLDREGEPLSYYLHVNKAFML